MFDPQTYVVYIQHKLIRRVWKFTTRVVVMTTRVVGMTTRTRVDSSMEVTLCLSEVGCANKLIKNFIKYEREAA